MAETAQILVIDDEQVICMGCKKTLESEGMEVDCVENGIIGIAKLNEHKYDIVLIDLMMPAMRGWEVLAAIQKMETSIIPIIISGYATLESSLKAMQKGAFAFLPKPFTPDELRTVVRNALKKRKSLQKNECNQS